MSQLERGKISGTQMVYLLVSFAIGSSIIIAPGRGAGHDAWFATIIGALESMVWVLIFTTLARRFPDQTIVEIMEVVFGPFLGKALAVCFVWYSFHLCSLVIGNFTDFFTTVVMPETPCIVFAVSLVLVSAFAVHNGLEVIARCGLVLLPIAVFLIISTIFLELNQLDLKNFLPFLETPWPRLLKTAHNIAVFPFGETVIFGMIFPYLNQPRDGRSRTVLGILLAAFILTLLYLRSIGVLGATRSIATYPALEAVKLIKVPFLNIRFEIIVIINFLTLGFLKITTLHYSTVLGLAQIFKFRALRPLIIPVGILTVLLSLINFQGFVENLEFSEVGYPVYALFFQLVIPLLTLIVAVIRKLPSRRTGC
ncbi:MAG: endospore germination permease [Firmicutes bacterium]|nr:endospore germination permease [Bacillota bacterium]